MRVLVCGGRNFGDVARPSVDADRSLAERRFVIDTLRRLSEAWPWSAPDEYGNRLLTATIITGGAPGADDCAADFAAVENCGYVEFKADWKRDGKAAGPVRNQRMIDEGKPDLVIAFPGGRGTADMVRRAEAAGIEVVRPLPLSEMEAGR